MSNAITHNGSMYDPEVIILLKQNGLGLNIVIKASECYVEKSTVFDSRIDKPIVIEFNGRKRVLLSPEKEPKQDSFEAILFTKHVLKKALIDPTPIVAVRQPDFKVGFTNNNNHYCPNEKNYNRPNNGYYNDQSY